MTETFSVCQFFANGSYEYVRRHVSADEAMTAFRYYASSVAAQHGTTRRVIITDGGDCIKAEWQFGKGIIFPPATTP
jgi:hypothetical protein